MSFQFRLVNPSTGAADTILPDAQEWSVSPIFSDVGAATLKYPKTGQGAASVVEDAEIALFLDGVELTDCRFIIEDTDENEVGEGTTTIDAVGRTMLKFFEEAIVYPKYWPTIDDTHPVEHDFTAATAGTIMSTLIQRAQTRGGLVGITYGTFSATLDSNGVAWTKSWNIQYSPGVTYLQVLQNLVDAGLCEIRMVGRDLRMYNPGTLGEDTTVLANPVILRRGKEITEAPKKTTSRELTNVQLIAGESGNYQEVTDAGSIASRRRRESYQSQANVSDTGTLRAVAQVHIDLKKQPRVEKTHALAYSAGTVLPLRDFALGDWVFSDVGNGLQKYRVRQTVLSGNSDGSVSSSVTLNDIIAEREVELARKVAGIVGGTTVSGGSNTYDTEPDVTVPNAPSSVLISSTYYTDAEGSPHAQITVSWGAVTQNTDTTAITDLQGYEVQWWYSGGNPQASTRVDAGVTAVSFSPINLGSGVRAQVRAFDSSDHYSAWSTLATATSATDVAAPPTPSTPVLLARIGALRATWDGLGSLGEAMPIDFDHLEVHCSATGSGFVPSSATLVDILVGAGDSPISGLTYATTYYVKFIAVDKSGNKSAASAPATGVPVQVEAPDLGITIGGANLVADSGFESGTLGGWAPNNAFGGTLPVLANDTTHVHGGSKALGVGGTPTAGGTGYTGAAGPAYTLPAGDYVASAWVYSTVLPGASGFGLIITASLVGGGTALTPPGATYDFIRDEPSYVDYMTTTGVWRRITTRFTITGDANVQLFMTTDGAEVEVPNFAFWVDDVQLEAGSIATAYAPKPGEILPGTITGTEIADNVITTAKMVDAAITAVKLGATIGGGNLLTNSRADNLLWGWNQYNSTIAVSTAKSRSGAHSFQVTSTAVAEAYLYREWNDANAIKVRPGEKYTLSYWVYTDTAGLVPDIEMRATDSTIPATTYETFAFSAIPTGVWTRYSHTFTMPANVDKLGWSFRFASTAVGQVVYMTDIQIEYGDVVTAYAPKVDEILPNTITATEIADDAITTPKLITDAVVANKIAANAVTAGKIDADAVTAREIAALTITAAEIAAGAISAEKLTIGALSGPNLVPNGGFDELSAADATLPARWVRAAGNMQAAPTPFGAPRSPYSFEAGVAAGGTEVSSYSYGFPVSGLKTYMASVDYITNVNSDATAPTAVKAQALFRIMYYDREMASPNGNGTALPYSTGWLGTTDIVDSAGSSSYSGSSAWGTKAGQFTPPSNAKWANIHLVFIPATAGGTNYHDWDNVVVREVQVSAAISDGAITTPKLVAGAVTANELHADAVTATKIATDAVVAGKIAVDAVTAREIQALTITTAELAAGVLSASNITTGTLSADITVSARIKTADTGARVELNSAGIKVYDAGGLVVDLSSSGSATFKGSIASGSSITGASYSGGTITGTTITGTTITGGVIQTATSGARIKIDSATANRITMYSGDPAESAPGFIQGEIGDYGSLSLYSPVSTDDPTHTPAYIQLQAAAGINPTSYIGLYSDAIQITGQLPGLQIDTNTYWGSGSTTSPAVQIFEASDTYYSLQTTGFAEFGGGVRSPRMRETTTGVELTSIATTSTTYTTTSALCDATFVAPPSGIVVVLIGARIKSSVDGNQGYVSFQLYQGTDATGTLKADASDGRAVMNANLQVVQATSMIPIGGLTPGATHYIRAVHRTTAGTATIDRRQLVVLPQA
jgi:hypothetical protein